MSGVRTYFNYADEGLIGEYDSTGTEIKTYGYKPGSTWTTDPLFMKVGSEYYFYHTDHLGTPQKMTATNGAVVWSAKYSSFGEANVEVGTVTNNLRFPGQYFDTETGLHYNYFRYYDPQLGRYLRVDPSHSIQPDGNGIPYLLPFLMRVPQELHNFSYAQNNSITKYDPQGLEVLSPRDVYYLIKDDDGCQDNFDEWEKCGEDAGKKLMACNSKGLPKRAACVAACAKSCLYVAVEPRVYAACVRSCGLGCSVVLAPGTLKCTYQYLKDIKECNQKYPI